MNLNLPHSLSCPWWSPADRTSHCKTNKYLIKVPLIVDGGHLAAVLRRVGSGGVEDQDVGRFSELSSVLQVPFFFIFWEKRGREGELLQLLIHIHSVWKKQRSPPSLIKVAFYCAEQPIRSSVSDFKEDSLQELYLISCSESTRNWGFHSWSFSTRSWGCLWRLTLLNRSARWLRRKQDSVRAGGRLQN